MEDNCVLFGIGVVGEGCNWCVKDLHDGGVLLGEDWVEGFGLGDWVAVILGDVWYNGKVAEQLVIMVKIQFI